jgi:ligand-binding sensor domain-containing protein/DNA-binding CsgD family transcriptional regulator
MKDLFILLSVFGVTCLCPGTVRAQHSIAIPTITNYNKEAYGAGTQNWKLDQDEQGILYVANNEGMLSFDGTHWNKYLLPNESIVRSVATGPGGKIYIGGQGEIGYYLPDKAGLLEYHSLVHLIPAEHREFADIWNVIVLKDEVFFRSNKRIFHLVNDKIIAYPSRNWDFLGFANGMLIANEYDKGLLQFRHGTWESFVDGGTSLKNTKLVDLVPLSKDSLLIASKHAGLFCYTRGRIQPFQSADLAGITDKILNGVIRLNENELAIATALGGCYIIDTKGNLVHRLSLHEGLQNNNIISISLDKQKNIWLGLDNGIDFVGYNSPIRHIYADKQEHSPGSAAIIHKNRLYIGLTSGLFEAPLPHAADLSAVKSAFNKVANSNGQVWNLSEVNQQLIMGHSDGAFIIDGAQARLLDGSTGFWFFKPLNPVQPSQYMLAGTYNGLNIYDFQQGKFLDNRRHIHFESSRFFALDNNIGWVAHPYIGLFKIDLSTWPSPTWKLYEDKKNILSKNRNAIYKIKNRVVLSTDHGLYEYNADKDDFVPCEFLRTIFQNKTVQYLKEDEAGNIWFIQDKHFGVIDLRSGEPERVNIPEMDSKLLNNGFDFIYPYNKNSVFVAGEDGFYLLNYEKYKSMQGKIPLLLSSVKAISDRDSSLFGVYGNQAANEDGFVNTESPELDFNLNSLSFAYSSPLYGRQASTEYSYLLENFDRGWSAWSKKTEKEYNYLPPGNYVFKVKARTHSGEEPAVVSYRFTILPPWYETIWAKLSYLVLIGLGVYGIYRWQKQKFELQQVRHEEDQKRIQYLHQLELEKSEAEIVRLRNEKLEAELQLKNKELTTTSINLVQRGEILHKVKDEVLRLNKTAGETEQPEDIKKIVKMLEPEKFKMDWDQFALHFNQAYDDFLIALKKEYPRLTPTEIKLCAYLRLNMNSKEIARIMSITIKSVELSRYRLRKKLELSSEENLFNFLMEFHGRQKNHPSGKPDG